MLNREVSTLQNQGISSSTPLSHAHQNLSLNLQAVDEAAHSEIKYNNIIAKKRHSPLECRFLLK